MGLRHKELEGMILPLISIDEFEPKTGTTEEVIVVAFFAKDELPAFDLDDFIDKGVIDFLDSEVSPNPNEDSYYLVFVEFKRQPNFWLKFYDLVKDIENATGEMKWRVQPYLVDELYKLHDKRLHDVVITDEGKYVPKKQYDATVEDFFRDSDLLILEKDDTHLRLAGAMNQVILEFVDFDKTSRLISRLRLDEQHIDLMHTSMTLNSLRGILGGNNWEVQTIGDYFFVSKDGSDRSVVLGRA